MNQPLSMAQLITWYMDKAKPQGGRSQDQTGTLASLLRMPNETVRPLMPQVGEQSSAMRQGVPGAQQSGTLSSLLDYIKNSRQLSAGAFSDQMQQGVQQGLNQTTQDKQKDKEYADWFGTNYNTRGESPYATEGPSAYATTRYSGY